MQTAHSYSFDGGLDLDDVAEIFKQIGPWIKPYVELAIDFLFRRLRHPKVEEAVGITSMPFDWYQPLSEPVIGRPAIQHQAFFGPLA